MSPAAAAAATAPPPSHARFAPRPAIGGLKGGAVDTRASRAASTAASEASSRSCIGAQSGSGAGITQLARELAEQRASVAR